MKKTHNYGIALSFIVHILIMVIPVSIYVGKMDFKDIELFVIDEERPVIQTPKRINKQKMPEVLKVPEQEVRKEEAFQKIEEKPAIHEEKTIGPTIISNEHSSISLPVPAPVDPTPLSAEVMKDVILRLHDVQFGDASGPKFLRQELPIYPVLARRLGKEGMVVLMLSIDEKGNLLNVEVIEKACCGFTEVAIDAVKKSTFLPAKIEGKPVPAKALLPIKFNLRRD